MLKIVTLQTRIHTIKMTVECLRFSVINANQINVNIKLYVKIVARLRISIICSTSGTVPIVQSQHRSHGNNNSKRFNDVK